MAEIPDGHKSLKDCLAGLHDGIILALKIENTYARDEERHLIMKIVERYWDEMRAAENAVEILGTGLRMVEELRSRI